MRSRIDLIDWSVRRGMLLTGIVLSASVAAAICLPMAVLFFVFLVLPLLLLFPRARQIVPFFCIIIVLLGLWRGALYRIRVVEPVKSAVGYQDTIEGVVEECPSSGNMFTVRITDSETVPIDSRVLLYCSDQVAPSLNDSVSSTVLYKSLYRTQRYRRADGIYLQAFPTTFDETSVASYPSEHGSWHTALRPFRSMMVEAITDLLNTDAGDLLSGVCLGDRSGVSEDLKQAFRSSGLSHLLSVSGLHMSVIAGGMLMLMRALRLRRPIGDILTAIVVFLFMWIVEFTPSVTRAGVMYLVVILGRMTRYQSDSLNSLGFALAIILVASPSSVYDIGLWLSFTATVGILCITPRIQRSISRPLERLPQWCGVPLRFIANSVAISLGCTLPTIPILLVSFGEVSLISPISNLLAVIPAGWMTILGCLGALLSVVPVVGFIGKVLLLLAGVLARWLIAVSECCRDIPGVVLRPTSLWIVVFLSGFAILLSVAAVRFSFRRVCCLACGMLFALIVALPVDRQLHDGCVTVAVTADEHGTVLVAERDGEAIVLMNDAADIYTASALIDDLRVSRLRLLVVNKCRTQDEAYLVEYKRDYPSLTIVSADEIGVGCIVDDSLAVGDTIYFFGDMSVAVEPNNQWLLSVGDTQWRIAMSSASELSESAPHTSAALVYASSLKENVSVKADAVIYVVDSDGDTDVTETDGLYCISNEEPMLLTTNGDGVWRRLRRWMYVLE